MPYIHQIQRHQYDEHIDEMLVPQTPGELNYVLSRIVKRFVDSAAERKGLSYQTLNDAMGAIDGCGREFYRRVVAPYEDLKLRENGDLS